MNAPQKPAHQHDCDECTYVGTRTIGGNVVDVYRHEWPRRTENLYRYGSDGPDYQCITEWPS